MATGRKSEQRSKLAGQRFELAVTLFNASYEAIVKLERWESLVGYFELKQIRRWPKDGLPLKRVDQVAAFFGLEAQAFIDDRIDQRDLMAALFRMKTRVIADGKKLIDLERVEPSPAPDYHARAIPDEFSGAFAAFMADRLRHFCGRRFVFDALDAFLENTPEGNGYFLITGDPGIGKSALMAKLIHDRNYLHHFNIGPQSINRPHHFLKNICRQLIHRYDLSCTSLPPDANLDGVLLNRLLAEAAQKLGEDEKMVIAIDALDEVDNTGVGMDANLLYLPVSLPAGVFVVATARRRKEMPFSVMNLKAFDLEANSPDNRDDAARYVRNHLKDKVFKAVIASWNTDEASVVDGLVDKSEGNFMYLRHVLPAIRAGNYQDGGLDELPQGLLNYYRHHWKQMRGKDEKTFDDLYRPVVCILATVKEAVSLDQIHDYTKIGHFDIQKAIYAWYEFLHTETGREARKEYYRVYHTLFQEFLYNEIEPGLTPFHRMIADYYLEQLGMAGDLDLDP